MAEAEKKSLQAEFLRGLVKESLDSEMSRYSSLISTSNRLLTCDSIILVAMASVPTLISNSGVSVGRISVFSFILAGCLVGASVFFCILSQWRFEYEGLGSPISIADSIDAGMDKLTCAWSITICYCKVSEKVYWSLYDRNNKIAVCLKVSTILLAIALGVIMAASADVLFDISISPSG